MNEDLLKALLNKFENVLNGGSDVAQASSDNYIAWCSPGIPFQPEDLQFAVKGINGKNAEETALLVRNAAEFSRVANAIPSSNVIGGTFEQNGVVLWDIYAKVLQFSKVNKDDITEEEEAKIEKLRGKLVVKKKVVDVITDEEKEITENSPIVKAYNEKMAAYINAVSKYNNKRLSAVNADSKQAVQDFTQNADLYRMEVRLALNDWVSNGYKEDIEKINAYIKQVSQRSMMLLKADLSDRLEQAKMTDAVTGSKFCLSSFYPGNFINTNKGWTEFSFTSHSKNTYTKEAHLSTSGNFGLIWGLWSAKGKASGSIDSLNKSLETEDFEMRFKITQATLGRGWFDPNFLTNGLWDWDQKAYGVLSDGNTPPVGQLIAYPTTAVFIKDVEIKSSAIKDVYGEITKTLNGGGSVGWGPFRIGATHSQDSKEIKTNFDKKDNTLRIEGMQLIAFKCFALPKTPDCKVKTLE
ncbi:hypothetical protein [Bacteroides graminisolvens]